MFIRTKKGGEKNMFGLDYLELIIVVEVLVFIAMVVAIVVQLKLFSIDESLKEITKLLKERKE